MDFREAESAAMENAAVHGRRQRIGLHPADGWISFGLDADAGADCTFVRDVDEYGAVNPISLAADIIDDRNSTDAELRHAAELLRGVLDSGVTSQDWIKRRLRYGIAFCRKPADKRTSGRREALWSLLNACW